MRRSLLLVLLCLVASPRAQADRRIWQVQSGEVLSRLALRFGVTVDDLREWNELDSDRLVVGQELRVGAEPAEGDESAADEAQSAERLSVEAQSAEPQQDGPERANGRAETQAPSLPERQPFDGVTYRVRRGDTLSGIASRHGAALGALRALNPHLNPDRLRVGDVVHIREEQGRRIDYRVRRGDTLSGIAARHRVRVRDIRRWNRSLRNLIAGRTIRIWSVVPESTSESIGAPNRGRLLHPERLPPHRGYVIRDRHRAFGTLETIMWIQEAFDAVREAHPRAPRVRLHDISDHNGGRMFGHRSHQSGRDADIAYFQKRCDGPCRFRRVTSSSLDAEKQWTLLRDWLIHDRVSAIFIDYSLQRPLYEEARRQGASRTQLRRWFQYPRGRGYPLGLVRHFPKHRDHLHVRFRCPDTDEECRR